MFRSLTAVGFALFVAQMGSCNAKSCQSKDCADSTGEALGVTIRRDTDELLTTKACSTCGHAEIGGVVRFSSGGSGTVLLNLEYQCGAIVGLWNQGGPRIDLGSQPISSAGFDWTSVNVKNRCGENAPITYRVYLFNQSSDTVNADARITCKVDESASPTAPSGSLAPGRSSPSALLRLAFSQPPAWAARE